MEKPSWRIEPFEKAHHERDEFDCGHASLNDWLGKQASQYVKRDLARLFVLTETEADKVLGYYTLSNHAVEYHVLPESESKGLPSRIRVPVALLGKLAVDRQYQGLGLGTLLLMDALRQVKELSNQIAIRAVEVNAIDDAARDFYLKFGFIPLLDDTKHLFLPTRVIRQLDFK